MWKEEYINNKLQHKSSLFFPLCSDTFDETEIVSMAEWLLTSNLTYGKNVETFENKFAKYVNKKYAVMCNSGSSANLLAANLIKLKNKNPLKNEILIPCVCWSTSVYPFTQLGFKINFVDVKKDTMNMDLDILKQKINKNTLAVCAVHILGNSCPINKLKNICDQNNLFLIEDTCESLGSSFNGKYLGTFGDFGTFSFYYSHHMTTGEGGMVVCDDKDDHDLLLSLRSHGWSRCLSPDKRKIIESENPSIDPRFLFINEGYNLRPMEIQAITGIHQLDKLHVNNANRIENNKRIIQKIENNQNYKSQFTFPKCCEGLYCVWFGICILLKEKYKNRKTEFIKYLIDNGIENRPIVSGNFTRQPILKKLGYNFNPVEFPGAEFINDCGLFIGVHTNRLKDDEIDKLVSIILSFNF